VEALDRNAPAKSPESAADEFNVLEFLIVLAKHKKIIAGLPFFVAIIAAAISLLVPNVYTGTARILPPQGQGAATSALLGNLGSLSGIVGASMGLKTPSDLYAGMLKGHTVADAVIARFDLRSLYREKTLVQTRRALAEVTSITVGKDGIVSVQVDDDDPKRAAALANAYVEELDRLTQRVAVTEGGRKRVFLEKQLRQAKDNLAESEVAMRKTMEKTGLIQLEAQGRILIESIAAIRAQVAAKEIELASMQTVMTESHPSYVRARQELGGLKAELRKLEQTDSSALRSAIPSAGKVPESGLEYVRKLRDVKYFETLFEVLAKQYEIARSEEAADSGMIQVVDVAVPPDYKSRPQRTLIVLISALAAAMIAVLIALIQEGKEAARRDPSKAARFEVLKHYLKISRRR
jgi:tyrosine-protein kinase Etk/Wzc